MKPQITLVYDPDVRDWEALYIDGKQITYGHTVDAQDVLEILARRDIIEFVQQNGTPGLTGYSFPEKLEDVQYDPDWTETYED